MGNAQILRLFLDEQSQKALAVGERLLAAQRSRAYGDVSDFEPRNVAPGQGPIPPALRPLGGMPTVPSEFPLLITPDMLGV